MKVIKQYEDGYTEEHAFGGSEKRAKDDWSNGYHYGKAERKVEILDIVDEIIEQYSGKGQRHLEGVIALTVLKNRIKEATDD